MFRKYMDIIDKILRNESYPFDDWEKTQNQILQKVSPQNKKKIRTLNVYTESIDNFWGIETEQSYNYFSLKCINAIITDEEYKLLAKPEINKKDMEILKLINAREEDFDFEEKIADVICGNNEKFPYKKGYELTAFFKNLGYNYEHDGGSRKLWVKDILKISNSYQIHKFLTEGVFKKKYFIEAQKDVTEAKQELAKIIEECYFSNQTIDISDAFGLNINNDILFNQNVHTSDSTFNDLIAKSKDFFIKGDKQTALEKIWDAFERIKTFNGITKKNFVAEIFSNNLSIDDNDINDELKALTSIGNNYQIRHYETNKKPIPNDITDSYGQKIDSSVKSIYSDKKHLTPDTIRKIFNEWIAQEYNPTHFLTVQLPDNQKTKDLYISINHLRNIMKTFEKSLMNNWNRHHLRFIAFAENGTSSDWHFHILFNQRNFTEEELQNAILKANIREKLPFYCLELRKIDTNVINVDSYCTKEINICWNGKFNSDGIIFSENLFNLNK